MKCVFLIQYITAPIMKREHHPKYLIETYSLINSSQDLEFTRKAFSWLLITSINCYLIINTFVLDKTLLPIHNILSQDKCNQEIYYCTHMTSS